MQFWPGPWFLDRGDDVGQTGFDNADAQLSACATARKR